MTDNTTLIEEAKRKYPEPIGRSMFAVSVEQILDVPRLLDRSIRVRTRKYPEDLQHLSTQKHHVSLSHSFDGNNYAQNHLEAIQSMRDVLTEIVAGFSGREKRMDLVAILHVNAVQVRFTKACVFEIEGYLDAFDAYNINEIQYLEEKQKSMCNDVKNVYGDHRGRMHVSVDGFHGWKSLFAPQKGWESATVHEMVVCDNEPVLNYRNMVVTTDILGKFYVGLNRGSQLKSVAIQPLQSAIRFELEDGQTITIYTQELTMRCDRLANLQP
jgi:hypothetical protein